MLFFHRFVDPRTHYTHIHKTIPVITLTDWYIQVHPFLMATIENIINSLFLLNSQCHPCPMLINKCLSDKHDLYWRWYHVYCVRCFIFMKHQFSLEKKNSCKNWPNHVIFFLSKNVTPVINKRGDGHVVDDCCFGKYNYQIIST